MKNNFMSYQTLSVEILSLNEDVISTSAINLPFIPMSSGYGDEEAEI